MDKNRHSNKGGNLLPEGWAETTLSEIAAVNPKNGELNSLLSGFIPMALAPTDFNGHLEFEEREWDEIKKKYTHFANGDVIFAKVTPCFENGKAAIVSDLPNGIGAGSSEFYVLRPLAKGISTSYIFANIKSHEFMQTGAENMTGAVGLRRVPRKFVEGFKVNLPPQAEQKVIADKLDTLLAQVETTKARLDRIPQILKTFRQSVLTAALSGKLTESWRNSNSTNNQWDSSISVNQIAQYAELLQLPSSWSWEYLGKIITVHNNLRKPLKKADRDKRGGDYPYYGAFGIIDDIDDFMLDGRYILLAEDGKNLETRTRPISLIAEGKFWVNNHAHVLKERKWINIDYVNNFLNSPIILIDQFLTGQDQVKLNRKAMELIPVPVPPLEEQTEIARRIEQLFAHTDKIEQQVQAAQQRVDKLTQSILAKAFRGELTSQWRKDNPALISGGNSAEALLAKIKAEREAKSPKKRVKTKKAKA